MQVFTLEPGLYLPFSEDVPEAYRGIGVRIEDDVLLTDTGCEILSAAAPKEVADIELLRKEALGSSQSLWQGFSNLAA